MGRRMRKRLTFVTTAVAASLALTGTALADPQTPPIGFAGCGVSSGHVTVTPTSVSWGGFTVDTSDCIRK